jgi:hypothetical protein
MFGTAVVNVLKKSWMLPLAVAIPSTAGLYWRDQHVSLFAFGFILLVALGGLVLVSVPIELHKLRKRL